MNEWRGRDLRDNYHSKLWVEPQRQCWGTGGLWDCLMFKVSGTTGTVRPDDLRDYKKRAREWEKTRLCMWVHIDRRTLRGATVNGAINNVNGSEQNSMGHYLIPNHEGVIMENVDNEDAYTKNIQLSHEVMNLA
ncbi:3311_t:CDS:2 [Dentiscutata erythropus]|uniref:3311_t:CDS:1 n=1 Tax=Dentiscutata erythropus TaxID=1348616 RepID=A0A9N9BDB8_9GLOM|nr:3311_t:CDS:2 [Dentiscutata erythropus]